MKTKNNTSNKQKKKTIYKQVLAKITPSKKELLDEKKLFEEIRKKVESMEGTHSHLEWCGSSARGTHLHGDRDLDLFLMFDKEKSDEELEREGLRIGKKVFKGAFWEKAYSQHPYIRGVIRGFDIEIVPGFIVKSGREKKSAVDRTPFHNKYLLKNMTNKQRSDARLLKQFLKGINAYGADLKNCSLPGYGVELLVLYYGSFEKTLIGITKWKEKQRIKFNNKKGKTFDDPLILVDPVDENRNVASALSKEQFGRIIFASTLFLKNPSIKFFFPKQKKAWNKNKVKKMLSKKELIAIKTTFPKNVLSDLVWGQLRRVAKKGTHYLEELDFEVERGDVWSNEKDVWFIFELKEMKLQKARKMIGPRVEDKENIEKFLAKKRKILSGPRVEEGRIVLETERKVINAKDALTEFIKENKKTETKTVKQILRQSKVLKEKDLLSAYKGEFAEFFSAYLEGKEIFE